ncbi:MAG: hypothetical protein ACK476_07540 [Fluviicola sp.]
MRTTNLNLNVGGVIHDVEYIPSVNAFAVVGKFDSIGGQARKSFALVNANNFTVINTGTNFNPITSIGGSDTEFRSIEVLTIGTKEVLMIGGAFDAINGQLKSCLLAMTRTVGAPTNQYFTLTSFNYDLLDGLNIYGGGFEYSTSNSIPRGVFDLVVKGDTLLVAGSFYKVALSGVTPLTEDSFFALKADPSLTNPSLFTYVSTSNFCAGDIIDATECGAAFPSNSYANALYNQGSNVFVTGAPTAYFTKLSNSFLQNTQFHSWDNSINNNYLFRVESLNKINDSTGIALTYHDSGPVTKYQNSFLFKTTSPLPSSGSIFYSTLPSPSNFQLPLDFQDSRANESYNGDVFIYKYSATNPNTLKRFSVNTSTGYLSIAQVGSTININTSTNTKLDSLNNLMVGHGFLFVSERTMTSASGSTRKGLAVYCLEPEHPKPLVTTTPSVCAGDDGTYSFYGVKNCDGYMYNYTGSNVQYSFDNGVNWFTATPNFIVNSSTTSLITLKIRFMNNATSGTLTITPFSTCNTATDYQFANPLTQIITVHPKPDINLISDFTQFDCNHDSIQLVAQSSFMNLDYAWTYNSGNPGTNNDSLKIGSVGTSGATYPDGWYYIEVTDTDFGCKRKDSLFITQDFTLPTIEQDSLVASPAVWVCSTDSLVINANIPNCSVYWTLNSDTTIQYSNPHTIYSFSENNFNLYATSNLNGCKNTLSEFYFSTDFVFVDSYLPAYSLDSNVIGYDTLNCFTDSLTVQCAIFPGDPNAGNATIEWLTTGTDVLQITEADQASAINDIRTYKYFTVNLNNSCVDTNELVIYFDFSLPFVGTTIGGTTLNCSRDTVVLTHQQTGGQVIEGWLDSLSIQTGLPTITADTTETYYYEVESLLNGCVNRDTIEVLRTNELLLTGGNDTLVCPGSSVTVNVSPLNNSEAMTYLWNTGSTVNSTSITGGNDTLSVQVNTPSGCIGYDTVFVSITAPISATIQGFAACESSGSLQVVSVSGGAGGYTYAIDNINFTPNPLFEGLELGSYTISIQDTLGCIYDFTSSLTGAESGPALEFLVTTYSGLGDTLAFVNTTVFNGFDSLAWEFPVGASISFVSDSLAFAQFADTGWYSVTLTGYIDSCSYSFTKTFHVTNTKPDYFSSFDTLGIKTISVYPNPTNGQFEVDIAFGIEQAYSIVVVNSLSQPIEGMFNFGTNSTVLQQFNFPSSASAGTYRIVITSTYDARSIPIVFEP